MNIPTIEYDRAAMRRINDERNLSIISTPPRPGYEQCLTVEGFVIEKRPNRRSARIMIHQPQAAGTPPQSASQDLR